MMQFMTATVLLLWTGAADSRCVQVRLVVYMIISLDLLQSDISEYKMLS